MEKIQQADAELMKTMLILGCFNDKKSEQDAFKFVNKTISCELEEIERSYKFFQQNSGEMSKPFTKNMEVQQAVETTQGLPIPQLSNEIVAHIALQTDITTHKSLYLTNRRMREVITSSIESYDLIEIWFSTDKNQMKTVQERQEFKIGMKRKHQDNNDNASEFNSIAELLTKLQTIIRKQNVKIKCLAIKHEVEDGMDTKRKELISGLGEMFGTLEHELHVEKLDICINDCNELMIILNRIKPDYFCNLALNRSLPFNAAQRNVAMDQLLKSPHWFKMKNLFILNRNISISPKDFIHIPIVILWSKCSDMQEIVEYKNILMRSESHHEFRHEFRVAHDITVNMLREALMPTITSLSENKGFFVREDGKKVGFQIRGFYARFRFPNF